MVIIGCCTLSHTQAALVKIILVKWVILVWCELQWFKARGSNGGDDETLSSAMKVNLFVSLWIIIPCSRT